MPALSAWWAGYYVGIWELPLDAGRCAASPQRWFPGRQTFMQCDTEGCCVAVEATLAKYQDASAALTWPGDPNSKTPRRSSSGAQL